MKIVVVGGTGFIGSRIVDDLNRRGHLALPASPSTGVDAVTGDGLAGILDGADVVVDVTNPPPATAAAATEFFETSTRNLLVAGAEAGVGHHVVLSVVGTDRLAEGRYFGAKAAQERMVGSSPIPFSVVRTTQFFEFLETAAALATTGDTVRLPPVLIQPLAAADAAAAVGGVATGPPFGGIVEFAGPDPLRLDEAVRCVLDARRDPRRVEPDAGMRYFGARVEERTLLPGDGALLTATRFDDWLGSPGSG